MRRSLLAGTAVGCLLLTTVSGASQATADPVTSAAVQQAVRGPRLPASCTYPPVSAPTVRLSASPTTLRNGGRVTLSGSVRVNSCGLRDTLVGLYANGRLVAVSSTSGSGAYSFSRTISSTTTFRVYAAPNAGFGSALSNHVTVTVTRRR